MSFALTFRMEAYRQAGVEFPACLNLNRHYNFHPMHPQKTFLTGPY